jgi:hypothetical protein
MKAIWGNSAVQIIVTRGRMKTMVLKKAKSAWVIERWQYLYN